MLDIKHLRREYKSKPLKEENLYESPFDQFTLWFIEAQKAEITEANAMILSTTTKKGRPSSRAVLLKDCSCEKGLLFFTNNESRKAREIGENPFVSVTFLWTELARQINIEGTVSKIPDEEAREYFERRPRGSQLGSWASHQDQIVTREQLEQSYQKYEKEFEEKEIPAPPYWSGFRIQPTRFEFWQGRENRLHDRFQYSLDRNHWVISRLSP